MQSYVSTEDLKPYHKPHYDNVKQIAPKTRAVSKTRGRIRVFSLVGLLLDREVKKPDSDATKLTKSCAYGVWLTCTILYNTLLAPVVFCFFLHLPFLCAHRAETKTHNPTSLTTSATVLLFVCLPVCQLVYL